MRQLDERILEYLDLYGVAFPSELANHPSVSTSAGAIRERAEILAGMDLLEISSRGTLLEITGEGRMYLRGDLRADLRLPRVDRSRV
jgi:hypothetical protein